MDCSTPGLPVPYHLPEFAQVHVHCIDDAIQPPHPLDTLFSFPIFPYFFLNFLPEKFGQVSNLTTILSFSFLVNMCMHSQLLGCVQLFVTHGACQAPLSMGFLRQEYRSGVAISFSRGSSQPEDRTHISCIDRQILYHWATWESQTSWKGTEIWTCRQHEIRTMKELSHVVIFFFFLTPGNLANSPLF